MAKQRNGNRREALDDDFTRAVVTIECGGYVTTRNGLTVGDAMAAAIEDCGCCRKTLAVAQMITEGILELDDSGDPELAHALDHLCVAAERVVVWWKNFDFEANRSVNDG